MNITFGSSLPANDSSYTIFIPLQEKFDPIALSTLLASYEVSGVEEIVISAKGKNGEGMYLYSNRKNVSGIVVIGMGKNGILSGVKSIFTNLSAVHKKLIKSNIGIDTSILKLDKEAQSTFVEQCICGLIIGRDDIALYKTDKEGKEDLQGFHLFTDDQGLRQAVVNGVAKGETTTSIINLVNAPSNHKTCDHLAAWLRTSANKNGYKLKVMELDELEKEGFHALLGVNRGSEVPAKCLIATYSPKESKDLPRITIVGKGVTFDTGGLSIKGRNNMHYMKSDMGGAAAAMGTIELASKLELPVSLRIIVPTTDNSVDAKSIKPGDVINSYSGKTIEVIDTDAEGRLILADALSYAVRNDSPDYLIDLATLTGSIVSALGTEAAGLMSKNDDLSRELSIAGERTGERVWRMPLWDDYSSYIESDIADIKNLGSKPMAGAITAGKFLEAFVENHPAWAHLDIAGTAFGNMPTTKAYSATGYGIDLLINWLSSISINT